MNNGEVDKKIKLLFNDNKETLKQCKIICISEIHAVVFECNKEGQFGIFDPNYRHGQMKYCNTLDEAINELNRIFKNVVFTFTITYYDVKAKNKHKCCETALEEMEKEYIKIILKLGETQLIEEAKQNLLFHILAYCNPDMLLQVLNMIPEDKRVECMLVKDINNSTSFHFLARYYKDMLLQVLNIIPKDKRVEYMCENNDVMLMKGVSIKYKN